MFPGIIASRRARLWPAPIACPLASPRLLSSVLLVRITAFASGFLRSASGGCDLRSVYSHEPAISPAVIASVSSGAICPRVPRHLADAESLRIAGGEGRGAPEGSAAVGDRAHSDEQDAARTLGNAGEMERLVPRAAKILHLDHARRARPAWRCRGRRSPPASDSRPERRRAGRCATSAGLTELMLTESTS